MKITRNLSDEAVLAEFGERISRHRIKLDLTQAALARQAGVAKRTLERIEAGASAQLVSLIRVLRVLDLLQNLEQVLPEARPGPMDLLRRKGRVRQRASKSRRQKGAGRPWRWNDET